MSTSPSSHHGHLNLCCPFHSPPPPPPQQHPTSTPTSTDQNPQTLNQENPQTLNQENPQTLNQENPLEIQQQPRLIIHYQHQLSERSSTAAPSFPAPASVTTHDAPPSTDSNTPPTLYTLYENIRCNLDVEKRQAIEKKCHILMEKLNPLPFVPSRNLNFSENEKVLKRLGLWDFVRTDFDRSVRADLIAEMVASYDPKSGCSYVNGTRIGVSRADLACAMKLPVKNKGVTDLDLDVELLEDSTSFIVDFLSNWVFLHGGTWFSIPTELLIWVNVILDGHPEKVDWAELLWFMVEKELTQGEHLVNCYYASHLQCLIKSQCEEVFLKGDTEKMELNLGQGSGEKEYMTLGEDNVDDSSMEVLAGPSHYENGGKRVIRDEDHITNQSLNASNKKSKIDEKCVQTFMDKIYEEFEETIKKRDEEIEKREKEIVSLKREINVKEKVVEAYREALVESEKLKCECKNKFKTISMETETLGEAGSNESYEIPTERLAVAEEEEEEGSNKSSKIPECKKKRSRYESKSECIKKFIGINRRSSGSWGSELKSEKFKKKIWLGTFPSEEAAARAYDAANLYINGSKAILNFPIEDSIPYLPSSNTDDMSIETIKNVAASAAKNTCLLEECSREGYEVPEDGSNKRLIGVYKNSYGSTWHSVIYYSSNPRVRIYLGNYRNAEAAAKAYDAANIYLNGSKAILNFPNSSSSSIASHLTPSDNVISVETIKRIAAAAAAKHEQS